jgi:SAM-dependent methyltransferase
LDVLDVCCAHGELTLWLYEQLSKNLCPAASMTGIDMSPDLITQAKERFEDKTEKKYDWNIDNYSVLKNELAAGIQARLSLSGYNLSLFKLLSRFIVPYPFNMIANQAGYLLKKAEDCDVVAGNAMKT